MATAYEHHMNFVPCSHPMPYDQFSRPVSDLPRPSLCFGISEPNPDRHDQPSREPFWVIERLFGEQHWCSQWVSELCTADARFMLHLAEQTPYYVHVLALVRLGMLSQPVESDLPIVEQARLIQIQTRRSLLAIFHPTAPPSLLNVLPKLGEAPLTKASYRRLLTLIQDPAAREFLSYKRKITHWELRFLEDFPRDLLHWRLLCSFENGHEYQQLKYMGLVIGREFYAGLSTEQRIALKRIKTLSELKNWFKRRLLNITFPDPPWHGNDHIRPIRTMRELQHVARQFRNCILGHACSVIMGRMYFYLSERGPVVISLGCDPFLGWGLQQIKGIANEHPSTDLVGEITKAFTSANLDAHSLRRETRLGFDALEALFDELS